MDIWTYSRVIHPPQNILIHAFLLNMPPYYNFLLFIEFLIIVQPSGNMYLFTRMSYSSIQEYINPWTKNTHICWYFDMPQYYNFLVFIEFLKIVQPFGYICLFTRMSYSSSPEYINPWTISLHICWCLDMPQYNNFLVFIEFLKIVQLLGYMYLFTRMSYSSSTEYINPWSKSTHICWCFDMPQY